MLWRAFNGRARKSPFHRISSAIFRAHSSSLNDDSSQKLVSVFVDHALAALAGGLLPVLQCTLSIVQARVIIFDGRLPVTLTKLWVLFSEPEGQAAERSGSESRRLKTFM